MDPSLSFEMDRGAVRAWLDGEGDFHIRIVDPHGDPVELAEHEVDTLISELARLRSRMED